MRFSDQWLRDCVETRLPPQALGARLTEVGMPLDSLEPFGDDTVYHFDVTTNRPDCMNHLGLGRELSVAEGTRLKEPSTSIPDVSSQAAELLASVAVESPDLCERYTALVIQKVKVGASPSWLARRLEAIGLRPINSVVDATNYVLWEMGHPLHAFDLEKLSGRTIRVRRAKPGERITTLDGVDRKLMPEMLVIADGRKAVAVAGVMGGRDSEIGAATTEVLLESAHFQAASVRKTSRALGLHTDASHRFERGADVEMTLKAAARCAALIAEVTGGRVARGVLEDRKAPPVRREIALRPERVRGLLGLAIEEQAMQEILQRLGCSVIRDPAQAWRVVPPSFRGDLSLEEDLVEEIARHHGYEKIPVTLPRVFLFPEGRSESEKRMDRIRQAARHCGFSEALNLTLVSEAENRAFGDTSGGVQVLNPLTEGEDRLRFSLVPGLLSNLAHNLNHHLPEGRLFEAGRVFRPSDSPSELPDEEEKLGLVLGGKSSARHWGEPERQPDFYDLKGALDQTVQVLGVSQVDWKSAQRPFLVPGRGAEILVSGRLLGWAGEVAPQIASAWDLESVALAGEISLRELFAVLPEDAAFRHTPLARTPRVSRDLSLILDKAHTYREVEAAIRGVEGIPVASVELFDRYAGASIPPGKIGMSVRIVFRSPERTMVSEEVSEFLDRIIHRLRDRLGAVLRGN
ncbi:MAG: phenylalanine--tRNA ligase subunit beta [Acidobacteria bacterium]|nr:phenylalanine--tRNA ligase subunit beta [Acidobacteriota bacterium]